MLDYIVIGILSVLALLILLIYQKINSKNDLGVEREVKEGFGNLKDEFGHIEKRLKSIEDTKNTIDDLKGNIIDFKNLFNNKTERGKFGEEYLENIIKDSINKKHYKFQHTLSNGKRPDCFLTFGSPEESICIDSKFSWENYKKMHEEKSEENKKNLAKIFREDIEKHIKDVSEKYVITGETAPLALMFVASEGVFRDIEKHPHNFVTKAREKNVVIVSPTTIWSFLRTYRLLIQNREMYELSGVIQKQVESLDKDIGRLSKRIVEADTKHNQISELFRDSRISIEKIQKHIFKILNLDLDKKNSDLEKKRMDKELDGKKLEKIEEKKNEDNEDKK